MKQPARSKVEKIKVGNVTVKIYKICSTTTSGRFRTFYQVADYSSGTRKLRSFEDHSAATEEARKVARQISTGNATAATMVNADAASYGRALELLKPTGTSLELAAAHFAEAFKILGGDRLIEAAKFFARHQPDQVEARTVAQVAEELVAQKNGRGMSERYCTDLRNRLRRFSDDFSVDISTVTTGDAQRWFDGLKLSPQSVKNFRTVLHTLFEFAEARGYIFKGGNPVTGTEAIKVTGGEIEIYTPAEISALLKAAPVDFLPVVAIGAFAGLRSAEIERISWKDIDLAGAFITVAAGHAKTKARRLVPIAPNLALWLTPYAKRTGLVCSPDAIRMGRAATVEASGVTWKVNALRHSYASHRLAQIQNAAQVALEMGNSPDVVFRHYRELVKPDAARAWFAVAPTS